MPGNGTVHNQPYDPEHPLTQEQIEQAEAEIAAAAAARETAESEAYRAWSVDAFVDYGADQSSDLLLRKFDEVLEAVTPEAAETLRDADAIRSFRGDDVAVVDPEGPLTHALVDSTTPLRTEDGKLPDLDLSTAGPDVEPQEPLTEVSIPDELSAGAELEGADVQISFEGAAPADPDARLISTSGAAADKEAAFYPEVVKDTDVVITSVPDGLETFAQIRSEESPEQLTMEVDVPAAGRLVATEVGGAMVLGADDKPVAMVEPPSAIDAQGAQVPVDMNVEGGDVVMDVSHQGDDWAYPILVDPLVVRWNWYEYQGDPYANGWQYFSNGWSNYVPRTRCVDDTDSIYWDCEGPHDYDNGGGGLYIYAPWYTYYPGNSSVQWVYYAPGASSYIHYATVYYYRWWLTNGSVQPYGYWGTYKTNQWINGSYYYNSSAGSTAAYGGAPYYAKWVTMGMGAGYTVTPTNYRYFRFGDVELTLDDLENPTLQPVAAPTGSAPAETGGWLSKGKQFSIPFTASDNGLGLHHVTASAPGAGGGTYSATYVPPGGCIGTRAHPCPASSASGAKINPFVADALPEGESTVTVQAYDAAGKQSTLAASSRSFPVRIDRNQPGIELADQLAQATGEVGDAQDADSDVEGLALPRYQLDISTDDTGGAGISGIKSVEILVGPNSGDLELAGTQPTQPACAPTCASTATTSWSLDLTELPAGRNVIRVRVTDRAGNTRTRDVELDYTPATGIKDEYVMQYVDLPDTSSDPEEGAPTEPELAVNVSSGNLVYHASDVQVTGEDVDLELDRYYNSQLPESEDTEWGDGWTLAQTPKVEPYSPFANGTTRTFEGWAKRDTQSTVDALISGTGQDAGTPYLAVGGLGGIGQSQVVWRPSGELGGAASWDAAWPGTGHWVHWALVFDESADSAELFINGLSKGTRALPTDYATEPGDFNAGAWRGMGGTEHPFDGKLDEIAVYDHRLTPEELRLHYGEGLYQHTVKQERPSLYWRLGDDSGTVASDASGSTLNGTYVGSPALNGAGAPPAPNDDGAIDLNGTSQFVSSSYVPFANSTTRTFEGWAKRDTQTTLDTLISGTGPDNKVPYLALGGQNGIPATQVVWRPLGNATGSTAATWDGAWPGVGQWVHWALTFNESTDSAELFINGESKGPRSVSSSYPTAPGSLTAGAWTAVDRAHWFDGKLDELAVFERALTLAEIRRHYGKGRYEYVVAQQDPSLHWRLGEDSGVNAADSSGHSRSGTYAGGPSLNGSGALSPPDDDGSVDLNGSSQYIGWSQPGPSNPRPDPVSITGPTGETNPDLPVAEPGEEHSYAEPQATLEEVPEGGFELGYEKGDETIVLSEEGTVDRVEGVNDSYVDYSRGSDGAVEEIATQDATPESETSVDISHDDGLVAEVSGPDAGSHVYDHDAAGNLTSYDSPDGGTTYDYDGEGNLTGIDLPDSSTASITYDASGRVTAITVDPSEGETETTTFEYSDQPRKTTVGEPGLAPAVYNIAADGSVLTSKVGLSSLQLILSGAMYGANGQTLPAGQSNLHVNATGGSITEARIVIEGIHGGLIKCANEQAVCEQLEGDWTVTRSELAYGLNTVEVMVMRSDGGSASERFAFYVPFPPEPEDEQEGQLLPPPIGEVISFRQRFGLVRSQEDVEMMQSNPAYWGSLANHGVPLDANEAGELDYRQQYMRDVEPLLAAYGAEHADSYAGYYVEHENGGTVRVGFTTDAEEHLDALAAEFYAGDRLALFPTAPEHTLDDLDSVARQILSDARSGVLPGWVGVITTHVEDQTNQVAVGVSDPTPAVTQELTSRYGSVLQVYEQTITDLAGKKKKKKVSRLVAGAGWSKEEFDITTPIGDCTLAFGAYDVVDRVRSAPIWRFFALTAGHCGGNGTNVAKLSGPFIGQITRSYDHDGLGPDVAAIHLKNPQITPRFVSGGGGHRQRILYRQAYYYKGQQVCQTGMKTGMACGEVEDPDLHNLSGMRMVQTDIGDRIQGDSGSPVWHGNSAIGVVRSNMGCGFLGLRACSVFTPITSIKQVIGVDVVTADTPGAAAVGAN